jgi:hypothetical protein
VDHDPEVVPCMTTSTHAHPCDKSIWVHVDSTYIWCWKGRAFWRTKEEAIEAHREWVISMVDAKLRDDEGTIVTQGSARSITEMRCLLPSDVPHHDHKSVLPDGIDRCIEWEA